MSIAYPWFILGFVGAAMLSTFLPSPIWPLLARAGRIGLTATLFLIGTGLSRASLKQMGPRPLAHGLCLWIVVATGSLAVIRAGWLD